MLILGVTCCNIFLLTSVAEECRSKHNLPGVPMAVWNSLLGSVDIIIYLCCTAEHINRKLSEQVANILDKLGLHTLHRTSTVGRGPHHAATHQGEDNWCV